MPLPLACVPGAIAYTDRAAHFALLATLFQREGIRLADGFRFAFPADCFAAVARFVENERRCCPFLTFAITASAEEVRLDLTGPPGTAAFLEAELKLPAGA